MQTKENPIEIDFITLDRLGGVMSLFGCLRDRFFLNHPLLTDLAFMCDGSAHIVDRTPVGEDTVIFLLIGPQMSRDRRNGHLVE